jgi:DNA-3-methyladenine glycosylase
MEYKRGHIQRLTFDFFNRDVLDVAPGLLGKILVRAFDDGRIEQFRITELEVYRGEDDLACHVSKGKTSRNKVMYGQAGLIYVYLVYGMHWMFNIVVNDIDIPQAILIRGLENLNGPGRLTKRLNIDAGFYGEDICNSSRIHVLNAPDVKHYEQKPRIGIDYAGDLWKNKPWRYILET